MTTNPKRQRIFEIEDSILDLNLELEGILKGMDKEEIKDSSDGYMDHLMRSGNTKRLMTFVHLYGKGSSLDVLMRMAEMLNPGLIEDFMKREVSKATVEGQVADIVDQSGFGTA